MNTASAADTIDLGKEDYQETKSEHATKKCSGRHKWSGIEVVGIVGGFIAFWPLGLLALGMKLVTGELWKGSRDNVMPWTAWKTWREGKGEKPFEFAQRAWSSAQIYHRGSSGNAAFDAYRKEQLDKLESERRRLDEEQKAFESYLAKLRRAKDQEEFDRFMAERNASRPAQP